MSDATMATAPTALAPLATPADVEAIAGRTLE